MIKHTKQKGSIIYFMIINISLLIFCISFYIYLISIQKTNKIEVPESSTNTNIINENLNETEDLINSNNLLSTTTLDNGTTTTDNATTTLDDDFSACTMDAKICPDGSSVGRTGANCEFVCPE